MKNTAAVLCVVAAAAMLGVVCAQNKEPKTIKAVAILSQSEVIKGTITFSQKGCGEATLVEVLVTGLAPNGQFGFHVHEKGDLSDGCISLGPHYNPDSLSHGAPTAEIRHVGDLGNIKANETGVVDTKFSDTVLSLTGARSIIGRGVIVHAGKDDLGLGGHTDSLTTGNAGGRAACGVIGLLLNEDHEMPTCGCGRLFDSPLFAVLPVLTILWLNSRG